MGSSVIHLAPHRGMLLIEVSIAIKIPFSVTLATRVKDENILKVARLVGVCSWRTVLQVAKTTP